MKPTRTLALAAALAFAGAALANMPPPEPKPPEAAPATAVQATEVQPDTAAAPEAAPAATPAPAEAPAAPAPQHPQGIEKAGPSGVIEGGWGYVYASYAVALVGLALYALSLWTRRPGAQPPSGDVP